MPASPLCARQDKRPFEELARKDKLRYQRELAGLCTMLASSGAYIPLSFAGFPEDSSIDALRGRSPSPSAAGSRASAGAGAGAGSGSGSGSGSSGSGAGAGKEAKSDAAAEPGKKKEKPHWVAELGEDVMCCICQELMVLCFVLGSLVTEHVPCSQIEAHGLPCGHGFCGECIRGWAASSGHAIGKRATKTTCPMCRAETTTAVGQVMCACSVADRGAVLLLLLCAGDAHDSGGQQ